MKSLIALLVFSISISAVAQTGKPVKPASPVSRWTLFLVNPELRYERSGSQEIVNRSPFNLGFAYQLGKYSLLTEFSKFKEESGNSTSSLERTHEDLSLWARYHFFKSGDKSSSTNVYISGGLGGFRETVTTTLMGASRTDTSETKLVSGLGIGGEFNYSFKKDIDLIAAAEARSLMGQGYDPNPMWSAVIRLGIQFIVQ